MPRSVRDQRGLSQSIQFAVLWPVLLMCTLGIIQAGVWIHGHNVAVRAANAAVDIARGSYGTPEEAAERATSLATSGGLQGVTVDIHRGAANVEVVVSAASPLIFDVGLGRISETASAPLERATQP